MDIIEAAETGDKRKMLTALRDQLAAQIAQTTSGRDLAALSKQFTEVVQLLDEMPNDSTVSKADEIAAKREARRAAAQ